MKIPRPYQSEAVNFGLRRNILVADDPGLGKTLTAIITALRIRNVQTSGVWRTLIVCPKRVRDQWVEEIYDQDQDAPIHVLEASLGPLAIQTGQPKPLGWYIIHYDILDRMLAQFTPYIWDVLIADEAHRLANRRNKWTRAIKRIPAVRKIALTATPMDRNAGDIWSIGNWLSPEIFTSYHLFYKHFVETTMDFASGREKAKGTKNTKQLARLLDTFMIRRTKAEVTPDLPPNLVQRVPVALDPVQRQAYERIENADDLLVSLEGVPEPLLIDNTLAQIVRLQQITSLPSILGVRAPSTKIEWTLDWLADNPNKPVIIFSKFRPVIEHLARKLAKHSPDIIIGGVQSTGQRFKRGETDILLGTIASMSEGLNFQRAEVAIFIDQHWSTRVMEQAINRIHRIGITEPKLTYYLYNKNTVDISLVLKALEEKWSDHELVYSALAQWRAKNIH